MRVEETKIYITWAAHTSDRKPRTYLYANGTQYIYNVALFRNLHVYFSTIKNTNFVER